MTRYAAVIAFWTLISAMAWTSMPQIARAQSAQPDLTTPDWGDYPMLMSQFGELCTMCEAYVQCSHNEVTADYSGPFNLYYFQTKTFWGQIATIWDYFAVWFNPVTSENRPATIYRFSPDPAVNISIPVTAYLSEEEDRLDIDGTWIDRLSGTWHDANNTPIGSCTRLGIPESMAMIAARGEWTEQHHADATP